jgi:hypothetical protein
MTTAHQSGFSAPQARSPAGVERIEMDRIRSPLGTRGFTRKGVESPTTRGWTVSAPATSWCCPRAWQRVRTRSRSPGFILGSDCRLSLFAPHMSWLTRAEALGDSDHLMSGNRLHSMPSTTLRSSRSHLPGHLRSWPRRSTGAPRGIGVRSSSSSTQPPHACTASRFGCWARLLWTRSAPGLST